MDNRIKYLESLLPSDEDSKQKIDDAWVQFDKYATYLGNGVYQWLGIVAKDSRELFLMGCLHKLNIPYDKV